jgi:quercetin dioxygenase-like cupin family protein
MLLERTRDEWRDRLDAGLLQVFSLASYASALRSQPVYARTGRDGMTLVETEGLRVVLEVLHGGAELLEHRALGPITLQVLEGEVRFHTGEETFRVPAGGVLGLPAGRPHAVEAVRDSAFLLTIASVTLNR